MAEDTMPVTEASEALVDETNEYEFAFHALPTVADEEVKAMFEECKALIARHNGTVTVEEMPQRFDLAYPIKKLVEGRYQRFETSFFGWIRFTLVPDELAKLNEEFKHQVNILRFMVIRLTREEAENPYRVFEKPRESAIVASNEGDEEPAESAEVLEQELDESLEELTNK